MLSNVAVNSLGEMVSPCLTPLLILIFLFIIYINDLHMASDKFNYILYADDTTLIGNISNFKSINMQCSITDNINIELDKMCDWLAVNKLSLNASKSNYMIFHHGQKNLNALQYQF